jgi:hypothetical protein
LQISHVKVNLRTKDVAIARRLVPPLDARAMEVFVNETQQLSREQLGSIFKAVLTEHQAKLRLLADIERANPTTERSVLLDDEVAQGVAYTLLAEHGVGAQFTPPEQQKWIERGRDTGFLIKVFEHLERLRDEKGIKISQQRLSRHVENAGAQANAVNLTRAQAIYLRALGAALLTADERYGDTVAPELDFAALIEEVRTAGPGAAIRPGTTPTDSQSQETVSKDVLPQNVPPANARATGEAATVRTANTIAGVSAALEGKRRQDGEWDGKTCRQARFIFTLFDRYLAEVHGLEDFCLVRQPHVAGFDSFLRGLHANFGKSTRDSARTIAEIQALAVTEVPKHGALQGATRNRHLTFLGQLIAYARGAGSCYRSGAIDNSLSCAQKSARPRPAGGSGQGSSRKTVPPAGIHRVRKLGRYRHAWPRVLPQGGVLLFAAGHLCGGAARRILWARRR